MISIGDTSRYPTQEASKRVKGVTDGSFCADSRLCGRGKKPPRISIVTGSRTLTLLGGDLDFQLWWKSRLCPWILYCSSVLVHSFIGSAFEVTLQESNDQGSVQAHAMDASSAVSTIIVALTDLLRKIYVLYIFLACKDIVI